MFRDYFNPNSIKIEIALSKSQKLHFISALMYSQILQMNS